jgi:hypothetical protein
MRVTLAAVLCSAMLPAPVWAQREVRAGAVRLEAQDTTCWSSAQVPCDDIAHAEVNVRASAGARVRVVSVEVMPDGGAWQRARSVHVLRRMDMVGTTPPRRPDGVVRFAAGERDVLVITFTPIQALEGRVRVTLDVGGRQIVLEAAHHIVTESPDQEL